MGTINGTADGDTLLGTASPDIIWSLGSNDMGQFGYGADWVLGVNAVSLEDISTA